MLVLSRRAGESIIIDKNIRVKVAAGYRQDAGTVSLYVDQPGTVGHYRHARPLDVIELSETIKIKVLTIGVQVRLGITAPRDVAIWRDELLPITADDRRSKP